MKLQLVKAGCIKGWLVGCRLRSSARCATPYGYGSLSVCVAYRSARPAPPRPPLSTATAVAHLEVGEDLCEEVKDADDAVHERNGHGEVPAGRLRGGWGAVGGRLGAALHPPAVLRLPLRQRPSDD